MFSISFHYSAYCEVSHVIGSDRKTSYPEVTEVIVFTCATGTFCFCTTTISTMATCDRRSPEGVEGRAHAQLEGGGSRPFSGVFRYVV